MSNVRQLPPRSAVRVSDTWDLSRLYASDDAWERDFNRWEKRVAGYARFQGGLAAGAEALAACLKFDRDFDRLGERLGTYAFLKTAEDATRDDYQRMYGRYINAASLAAILAEPDFLAGATPTAYLAEHPEVLTPPGLPDADQVAHLAAAVLAADLAARATSPLAFAPLGWRNLAAHGRRATRLDGTNERHLEYAFRRGDLTTFDLLVGPPPEPDSDGVLAADERCPAVARLLSVAPDRIALELDGVRHAVDVEVAGDVTVTRTAAGTIEWITPPRFADHDLAAEGGGPHSPLPGTVIAVHVEPGQAVDDGQLLMVVEAMKMEHKITAAGPGVVAEVRFAVGDRVDQGDLLVALEAAGADGD